MGINSEHIQAFLRVVKASNLSGLIYSKPGEDAFEIWLQENEYHENRETDRYFIFHPFDHNSTPEVVIYPEKTGEAALKFLHTCTEADEYWVHPSIKNMTATSREEYAIQFGRYKNEFTFNLLEKAVLSTIVKKELPPPIQIGKWLLQLRKNYPQSFVYIFSSPLTGTWVGATPEMLVQWKEDQISSMSLAGTKKNGEESHFGVKEKREQEIVTSYIHQTLEPFSLGLSSPGQKEITYGNIQHLQTIISGKTKKGFQQNDLLKLAEALHPTPAVGGYPKEASIQFITSAELHSRLYYSGYMGFIEPNQADLYVNLRCSCLSDTHALIFAGGGLTSESEEESEWRETRLKAEALTKFL